MARHDEGKIGAVGVSNFTVAQTEALAAALAAELPLAATQPQFSAAHLAPMVDGTFDLCCRMGLLALAWSPLEGGASVRGSSGGGDVRAALIAVLDELAEREDVDRAAVTVALRSPSSRSPRRHPREPTARAPAGRRRRGGRALGARRPVPDHRSGRRASGCRERRVPLGRDQLRTDADAGIDAFILSGHPHQADCHLFARHVLPHLRHAPLARTAPVATR